MQGVGHTVTLAPAKSKRLAELLTPQQLNILALMAEGKSNRTIAGMLFIEERTVWNHIREIFSRLGLTGNDTTTDARVLAVNRYRDENALPQVGECRGHFICNGHRIICA